LFVLCTFILKLKLTCSIQFSKTKNSVAHFFSVRIIFYYK